MKKILMALMLCLVSIGCFGQSWDYISYIVEFPKETSSRVYNLETNSYDYHVYITHKVDFSKNYSEYCKSYNDQKWLSKAIYMPSSAVLYNYRIGYNCFKAGQITMGIGVPISFIGAMCILCGIEGSVVGGVVGGVKDNNGACIAGYTLLGIGGTFISVSIPLFCFGDHIKRECNMVVGK